MNSLSIDDALTEDHVQLDGLFRSMRTAVGLQDAGEGVVQSEFERRLFRHMKWEEEEFFSALRGLPAGYPERKIESLEIDHNRIREKLHELSAAVRSRDWAQAGQFVDDLWVLLEGHNRDEEKGVYTDGDRLISQEDRRRLLERWRSGE